MKIDRYTDFVNRNTSDYTADMRHLIATFMDDVVEFADAHHIDRERTLIEVGQSLRTIPSYADLSLYRTTAEEEITKQ